MARLDGFDANTVDPMQDFDAIPAGDYLVVMTDSDWKPTKAGTGRYLELTFQIIEGDYEGRRLWTRLNLDNPSEKAVEFARAELSSICRATSVMAPKDTAELHDRPLIATVKCKRRDDNGEVGNEIKAYAPKAAVTPPRTDDTTAPWARKA
jgi:hypothetical protein